MTTGFLPEKLRELRLAHGYKQIDVAVAIDVVQQTYSHYETGKRVPDTETLYKLAGFYGIPVADLIQISIPLDRTEYYEAPSPTPSGQELADFLEYVSRPEHQRKFKPLNRQEKEMLYLFQSVPDDDRQELVEIARIKYRNRIRK